VGAGIQLLARALAAKTGMRFPSNAGLGWGAGIGSAIGAGGGAYKGAGQPSDS